MYAKDYKEYLKTHNSITINYAVVSHCNLQCIGCRVHAPIAPKWFVSDQQYGLDINNLIRLGFTKQNLILGYFGGEPLLHPRLANFIQYNPFRSSITTNGKALLNMPINFWAVLSLYKVPLYISIYNRSHIDYIKIFKLAKQYGIEIHNVDDSPDMVNKEQVGGRPSKNHFIISRNDPEGRYNIDEQFKHCQSIYPIIQEGKLYKCIVHNITALNTNFGTNFKLIEGEDYLVLDNIKNKEEIFNWLVKPMPFCKYCGSDETTGSYNHNEYVLWEPSMKKANEWLIK